ncbi:HTH domain-containing protein [Enterococcus casseliflavus]|nr:HTH domain-containing protein [Enterococcus casseliflavus]
MQYLQLKFIVDQTLVRLFKILNILERTQLTTKSELAEYVNVSERTVLNDINKLKDYFLGSIKISSTNMGYSFELEDAILFLKQKEHLLQNEVLLELLGNIFYGESDEFADLTERFHLSETTLRRYIKQIEPVFEEYELRLTLSPIDLKGNEANIRKFFKDFFYEGNTTPQTLVPPQDLHEFVRKSISDEIPRISIGTGTSPVEFYYSLYIAIERSRQGNKVTIPQKLVDRVIKGNNFQIIYLLQPVIKEHYNVELSTMEFCWLYLITICKRPLDRVDHDMVFCEQLQLQNSFDTLTKEYLRTSFPELQYTDAYWVVQAFFYSRNINHLITPVQNKIMFEVIESTKHEYSQIYIKNYLYLEGSLADLGLTSMCLEDISASLTLLIVRLQEQLLQKRKKVFFLLEGDLYTCQNIKARAIYCFGDRHDLFFITIQMLTNEFLGQESIDLVVTNYSDYLYEYTVNTDFLLIKLVPDNQDWQLLFRKIDPLMLEILK